MTLNIVILGLSITSSWGNGHATTYRALVKALKSRGHNIVFLERDAPWYRDHRDLPRPPYCRTELYKSMSEAAARFTKLIIAADLVIIGSYVPDGVELSDWILTNATGVTAFYDIDTPVTLDKLSQGGAEYISAPLIPRFDLYLSFAGGPALDTLEKRYGAQRARPLYCSVDPDVHAPLDCEKKWGLGYLGTYSEDRQAALGRLLVEPARRCPQKRFAVVGSQYPATIAWPPNIDLISHLPPNAHPEFYCGQEFTLNVTRAAMISAGYSPSVRLFEAAACGVPIISDRWPGLDEFFAPSKEILVCNGPLQVLEVLRTIPKEVRSSIGEAARRRVLQNHTAEIRAATLEDYHREAARPHGMEERRRKAPRVKVRATV